MAYFTQNGAVHGWNGATGYIPAAPITRALCDTCAIPEVPIEPVYYEVDYGPPSLHHYRQCRPWKWHPNFGSSCDTCDKRC